MRPPRSIFWRLSLLFLVVLTASLIGHGLFVVLPATRVLVGYYQESLARESGLAASALEHLLPLEEHLPEIEALLAANFAPAPNLSLLLVDRQGRQLAGLRPPTRPEFAPDRLRERIQEMGEQVEVDLPFHKGRPPLTLHRIGPVGSGYFVVVTAERTPRELVLQSYPGLRGRSLLLTFLAAAAAGLWGLRLFSHRLQKLREGMESLAQGDLSVRLDPGKEDEVGTLLRAFNHTAEKLQQAEAELSAQDRSRREMLADVSHELRTPLTTIRGHLELLQDDLPGMEPGAARSLGIVWEEVQSLGQRIEDLLTLSRDDNGQLPLLPGPTDLADLVQDVAGRFRDLCAERGIELSVEVPPEPLVLDLDRERIVQVIRNLMENALHNLVEGNRLRLRLSAKPSESREGTEGSPRSDAVFEIEDDGPGIPEEEIPHLFERFRRGQGSRGAGTGLGLAIARRLVERHGGEIQLQSQLGEGTTFRIRLPG